MRSRQTGAYCPVMLVLLKVKQTMKSQAGLGSFGVGKTTLINTVHSADRPESLAFSRELLLKLALF